VSVVVLPEQIVLELTLTVGVLLTVMVAVFKLVQVPLLPVTVYTVVVVGLAAILAVKAPVFQV
jgi:hypothetical protein